MSKMGAMIIRALGLGLAACGLVPLGAFAMQEDRNLAVEMVRIPDQDYFQTDPARHSKLQHQLIVMNRYEGIVIGAPRIVDLDARNRLPVLWSTRETNLRAWKVIGPRNSTVVIADLATGRVGAHNAFFGPKKEDYRQMPRSGAGREADVVAPTGATAQFELLDLREVANLPWQPGRLAVTVLSYDRRSNTVEIELTQPGSPPVPASGHGLSRTEVLAVVESHRRQSAATFPAFVFGPAAGTPELRGQGIAAKLTGQRSGMTQRWFLDGAARLMLAPGNIVAQTTSIGSIGSEPKPTTPVAVVPISILIAELDTPVPKQIDVRIPVFSSTLLKTGDEVSVAFRVDIGSAMRSPLQPGTYQIYVVGQQYVAGPYLITVAK